jgi:hypothetical protein
LILQKLDEDKKNNAWIDTSLTPPPSTNLANSSRKIFVNADRLNQLRQIQNPDFDFSKLIRLCEELDVCFHFENYLSVAMLLRAILDHIPPIFKFENFQAFLNNYGGAKETSFKKIMQHLSESLKNIANIHLHQKIRAKESLPNETQVDFRQNLDVLLAEIIRVSKINLQSSINL